MQRCDSSEIATHDDLKTKRKHAQKISYLYYSIFGRAPDKKELQLAINFFSKAENEKMADLLLALLNSLNSILLNKDSKCFILNNITNSHVAFTSCKA